MVNKSTPSIKDQIELHEEMVQYVENLLEHRRKDLATCKHAAVRESIDWDIKCLEGILASLTPQTLAPQDDELYALIEPLWKLTKPSYEAQEIRAALSTSVDDPKCKTWPLDAAPDYVWMLVDIAAQRALGRTPAPQDDGIKVCEHIIEEGSRRHVLSYYLMNGKTVTKCNVENCEVNHGGLGTFIIQNMAQRTPSVAQPKNKIIEGLEQAVAYAKGNKTQGTSEIFNVAQPQSDDEKLVIEALNTLADLGDPSIKQLRADALSGLSRLMASAQSDRNAVRDDAREIVLANTVTLHGKDKAEVLFDNLVAAINEALKYRENLGFEMAMEEAVKAVEATQNSLGNLTHGYHCGFLSGKNGAADRIRSIKPPSGQEKA